MDRIRKILIGLCLVLAGTSAWLGYVLAVPSPTINRVVTPGAIGPCTWFISLDGTTPVAQAMVGGLSVNPGDNVVGTAGQDIGTFLNSITQSSQQYCFSGQTFTLSTTWNLNNNDGILSQQGTTFKLANNANTHLLTATSKSFVVINGGTWDLNGANQADTGNRNDLIGFLFSAVHDFQVCCGTTVQNTRYGAAIAFSGGGFNNLVANSFILNNGIKSAQFLSDGIYDGNEYGDIFRENILTNYNDTGIVLENCSKCTAQSNYLQAPANVGQQAGITVDSQTGGIAPSNDLILGNILNNTANIGIRIIASVGGLVRPLGTLVEGNSIFSTFTCVVDGGDQTVMQGNRCQTATNFIDNLGGANKEAVDNAVNGITKFSTNTTNLIVRNNVNFNPIGKITSPFNNVGFFVGYVTTASPVGAPSASTTYVVQGADLLITSTGGTGVSITILDPSNNVVASPLTTLTSQWLLVGYKINWGGYSVAPTVTVFGN